MKQYYMLHANLFSHSLRSFIFFSLIGTIFVAVVSVDAKPWSAVAKRYRKELAQEEKRIVAEFLLVSGRNKREWKRWKNIFKKAFFHYIEKERTRESQRLNDKEVSPMLENFIRGVLKEHGINPNIVFIVRDNEANSPMSVSGGNFANKVLMRINEKTCMALIENSFDLEAVILHEIQHIKHDDCYFDVFASKVIDETYDQAIKDKLFKLRMRHDLFVERRADILAALTSPEHAQASIHLYDRLVEVDDWCKMCNIWIDDDQHPTSRSRATYLRMVYNEMLEAIECSKNKRFFGLI